VKRLGIVGGLGPESTIEYYREVMRAYRERVGDGSAPEFIVDSVNNKKVFEWMAASDLSSLADYLLCAIQRLAGAGADFAIISANMPHLAFDQVRPHSPIPLIHIVEAAAEAASKTNLRKLGLFGTQFVMQARLYSDIFARKHIQVVSPTKDEQAFIHDIYVNELLKGIVRTETRQRLLAIADSMKRNEGIEGLLLGGTELSLIIKNLDGTGLELLDTMKIQVQAALAEMFAKSQLLEP
jgi:aspartate racemase